MSTDVRDLKPFFKRHQVFTRILATLTLPISPFVAAGIAVWDRRDDILDDVINQFALAFGRWEE